MDEKKPVKVSGGAFAALSQKMRQWSGWGSKATLVLGPTGTASPFACCYHDPAFKIIVNPETLLLNPNRVLNTVSPFRLRQEAVLTGALLHECGHARHSHWQPGRYGNAEQALHGTEFGYDWAVGHQNDEGKDVYVKVGVTPVSDLTMDFAKTLEEARVEGLIAGEATAIGAHGLAWTMRVSAIKALPLTEVSLDPDQAVLDVVCSWIMRAGRHLSVMHHTLASGGTAQPMPSWVSEFNALLSRTALTHFNTMLDVDSDLTGQAADDANDKCISLATTLYEAITAGPDEGADQPGSTFMVDIAKRILDLLFPDTDQQEELSAPDACAEDQGEPEPEPEDSDDDSDQPGEDSQEDSQEDESGDESDEEGDDGESEPDEGDEPGDGDSDGDGDTDDGDSDSDSDDGQPDDGGSDSADAAQAQLQEELTAIEQKVSEVSDTERIEETKNPSAGPDPTGGKGTEGETDEADDTDHGGDPDGATGGTGEGRKNLTYRLPTKSERGVKSNAAEFLRNIIDPSEVGKMQTTDSPSATVDGAALAAWKAGGQTAAPMFFRRVKRTDAPAPPVKIAILVDVSASMDVLQAPSALLSWALSAACLDLRNFAGRGVQVESTLIHWGSSARVIQPNGAAMPGIHTDPCMETTSAMAEALDLAEQQLPGFFDEPVGNENRLLVQFTDWELSTWNIGGVTQRIDRALTSGVNMLSVVPMNYSWRSTRLDPIMAQVKNPKGRNALLRYNINKPEEVWTAAAEVLSGVENSNYGF